MENHSVGCEGDSHKQTTELTSVLPQVHLSLQQMQTTTDNNLPRPILPERKYLPWQAIRSNQTLHFDGALHTGCFIFGGQVLGYFFVHLAKDLPHVNGCFTYERYDPHNNGFENSS